MLSDPTFYFAKNDPLFNGTYPDAIIARSDPTRSSLDATFTAQSALSWEFVGGLKMGDPATTPIAFSRGLTTKGTWDPARGVYKDTGGHVVFLGGNVVFYPDTTQKFVSNASGQLVSNVLQALPTSSSNPARVYATASGGVGTAGGTPAGVGRGRHRPLAPGPASVHRFVRPAAIAPGHFPLPPARRDRQSCRLA